MMIDALELCAGAVEVKLQVSPACSASRANSQLIKIKSKLRKLPNSGMYLPQPTLKNFGRESHKLNER